MDTDRRADRYNGWTRTDSTQTDGHRQTRTEEDMDGQTQKEGDRHIQRGSTRTDAYKHTQWTLHAKTETTQTRTDRTVT
ncbi:hypothetical protein V3C99_012915 [Haemonchus contortus]